MYDSSELEKPRFLYKLEGQPQRLSIIPVLVLGMMSSPLSSDVDIEEVVSSPSVIATAYIERS